MKGEEHMGETEKKTLRHTFTITMDLKLFVCVFMTIRHV